MLDAENAEDGGEQCAILAGANQGGQFAGVSAVDDHGNGKTIMPKAEDDIRRCLVRI